MSIVQGWFAFIMSAAAQYPALAAIAAGALLSWAPGLFLEAFLPTGTPARSVKQVTLSVTVIAAVVVSSLVWHALAPADGRSLRLGVSIAAAFAAPYIHVLVAAIASHYVPFINSVFAFKKDAP